ncbi:MAG: hypothetical protein R3346_02715 [Candidatus Spechtbacterales bacterium]|nr:hypothetical protein [Candidatus Spechtbacterales bacterium]
MQKIIIIGISAIGKTWFSKELSKKLGLPVFHLDTIFWKDNWEEQDPEIVKNKISELLSQDSYIIEGYIEPLSNERIKKADTIIYLDFSGYVAFFQAIKRWFKHRQVSRPELPQNNIESLGFKFFMTILFRKERDEIEKAIKGYSEKVIRLKNKKEAHEFLVSLDGGTY